MDVVDAIWADVELYLRENGEDPDALMERAARQLEAWCDIAEVPDLDVPEDE